MKRPLISRHRNGRTLKRQHRLRREKAKQRALHVESLEPRLLLTTTPLGELEKQSLKEAFQALTGFVSNLEQNPLLTTNVPIVDKSIGDLVDVDQVLKERFLTPVEQYLETAQPTLEGFQTLFKDGLPGIASSSLGDMQNLPVRVPNISFDTEFDIDIAKTIVFETDLGGQLAAAGIETSAGNVMTELNFELHFGAMIHIDLSAVGGAPSDVVEFTLLNGKKEGDELSGSWLMANAKTTLDVAEVSIGIAGAAVNNAEFAIDVALPMKFGGQAFSLAELQTTATNVASGFSLDKDDASASKRVKLTLPLTVEIGRKKIVDNESLIIKDDDIFDDQEFDSTDTTGVFVVIPPGLTDFREMGNEVLFGVVEKLGGYFAEISESEVFQTEIPFTDGQTLGDVLNLREAFDAKVLDKARESTINTSGGVIDTAKQVAADARTAGFKSVQDLANRNWFRGRIQE